MLDSFYISQNQWLWGAENTCSTPSQASLASIAASCLFPPSPVLFRGVNVTPGGIPDVLEPQNHTVLNMKVLREAWVSTEFPNTPRLLHIMKTSAFGFHLDSKLFCVSCVRQTWFFVYSLYSTSCKQGPNQNLKMNVLSTYRGCWTQTYWLLSVKPTNEAELFLSKKTHPLNMWLDTFHLFEARPTITIEARTKTSQSHMYCYSIIRSSVQHNGRFLSYTTAPSSGTTRHLSH